VGAVVVTSIELFLAYRNGPADEFKSMDEKLEEAAKRELSSSQNENRKGKAADAMEAFALRCNKVLRAAT
jgi:hypothetical protein